MKCSCGRTIRNRQGAKHRECSYCRDRDASASRRVYSKNGKVKVGRLYFSCPCREKFSILFTPRDKAAAVCPRCKSVKLEVFANARLEEFSITVTPHESGKGGI